MATKVLVILASAALIVLIVGVVMVLRGGSVKSTESQAGSATPSARVAASPSVRPATAKLESTDEVVGSGAEVKENDTITVKYTGTLADGTVFDSTDKQGGQPATFKLAKGSLIDGWVQGIPGMKVGGKRKLVIPPDLAYGASGRDGIPSNATLTFEIELLAVK